MARAVCPARKQQGQPEDGSEHGDVGGTNSFFDLDGNGNFTPIKVPGGKPPGMEEYKTHDSNDEATSATNMEPFLSVESILIGRWIIDPVPSMYLLLLNRIAENYFYLEEARRTRHGNQNVRCTIIYHNANR